MRWPRCGRRRAIVLLDDDGRALADATQQPVRGDRRRARRRSRQRAIFLGLRDGAAWFAQRRRHASTLDAPQRVDLRSAASAVARVRRHRVRAGARAAALACAPSPLRRLRRRTRIRPRRLARPLHRLRQRALPAHRPGDHRRGHRRRAPAARPPGGWPARRWSVLAGFVEPGESLEQTVAREVLEESRRARAQLPLPRLAAVAVSRLADARLHRRRRAGRTGAPATNSRTRAGSTPTSVRAGLARDWNDAAARRRRGSLLSPPISISRWLIEHWLADVDRRQRATAVAGR